MKFMRVGIRPDKLFDSNFGAFDRFAAEETYAAFAEFYDAVFSSMNRKVAGNKSACTCTFGQAGLTDNNLAGSDLLAAK